MVLSFVDCDDYVDDYMDPDDDQLNFIRDVGIDVIAELDRMETEEMIDEMMNLFGADGCDLDDMEDVERFEQWLDNLKAA